MSKKQASSRVTAKKAPGKAAAKKAAARKPAKRTARAAAPARSASPAGPKFSGPTAPAPSRAVGLRTLIAGPGERTCGAAVGGFARCCLRPHSERIDHYAAVEGGTKHVRWSDTSSYRGVDPDQEAV